ncbi:MAG: hypothetical protein ACRDUY_13405 [Nitriliruptorales bacterium]
MRVSALLAGGSVLAFVLWIAARDAGPPLLALLLLTIVGFLVFAAGVIRWRGGAAFWLRLIGWVSMVIFPLIPSQMTLLLPLAAPLVVTLHRLPSERGATSPSP